MGKNITASIPLGTFTCVTGVSGGGKSSLVIETIWKIAARVLHSSRLIPGPYDAAEGLEYLDKVVDINQSIVDDPGAVNKDPEGAAWFFKIKIKNKSELDQLMSKADYDKFAKENPN